MSEVVIRSMILLKGINLLEEIKVALITAFKRLIGLFTAKDIHSTLVELFYYFIFTKRKKRSEPLGDRSFLLLGVRSSVRPGLRP